MIPACYTNKKYEQGQVWSAEAPRGVVYFPGAGVIKHHNDNGSGEMRCPEQYQDK